MLENMISSVLKKEMEDKYQHVILPGSVYAKITFLSAEGYYLKILGKNGQVDEDYPELVGIKSALELSIGDNVLVVFPYGELNKAHIVGKVIV